MFLCCSHPSNPEPEKPIPPPEFDKDQVLEDIEKRAKLTRRNPGEPKLTLELTMSGKTTKEARQYT